MKSPVSVIPHVRSRVEKATLTSLLAMLAFVGAPVTAQTDVPSESGAHSSSIGAAVTDTAITAKVKTKIMGDKRLDNSHVTVTTTNGVVALGGTVPTAEAKEAAESAAQSVEGVKSVDNQIQAPSVADRTAGKVDRAARRTGKAVSDSWITTKVKSQLLADSTARQADVSVKTTNGVVALSGNAGSQDAADHIKDIAQQVHGVKSVDTSGLTTK